MTSFPLPSSPTLPRTIAVDYRMCRSSGIGVYLRSIVRRLVDDHASDFHLSLLGGEPVDGVSDHRPCRSPIYSLREQVEVPARIPRAADVFWSPNYNAPLASRGRLVVTVHDLCHLALPELFSGALKQGYAKVMFRNVARRADRVICVSRFTASELIRFTGIDPERIAVVHCGVDRQWSAHPESPRPIPEPYILFVGNVKPHKNLGRLLDAFARLTSRVPHTLTIVGKREGFITPDHLVAGAAVRLGDRVRFTGEISDDALRAYYAHADLLAFPSLYEGFGMPPLEAMSAGIPVAASRAASIPEICGDAVAYFDPYSIDDMSATIERTLGDTELRARLADLGRQRVDRYSWTNATAQVASVFRSVVGG